MRQQHALWIRWTNGTQDKFELTQWEFGRVAMRGLHRERLDCVDGTTLWIRRDLVAAFKLFYKEIPVNPMNHKDHYDNPTN